MWPLPPCCCGCEKAAAVASAAAAAAAAEQPAETLQRPRRWLPPTLAGSLLGWRRRPCGGGPLAMSCRLVRSPPSVSGGEEVPEEGRAWAGCSGCQRPGRRRRAEGWVGRGLLGQALGMEHRGPVWRVGGGGVAELGRHPEPGGG